MRFDTEWLSDMRDALAVIEQYRPATRERFDADEPLQSHLLRQLQIIGEAVGRISPELQARYPQVPWRQIAGMRNAIVHAYFQIDWNEVWDTIERDVPVLKLQISKILETLKEFS